MICLLSIEVLIRSHYIALISSTIQVSKKATYIILNKNISDHWKENIIPKYSMQMMKYSLQMLIILFLIIFFKKFGTIVLMRDLNTNFKRLRLIICFMGSV